MTTPTDQSRSPFHDGEIAIQQSLGIAAEVDQLGRRMIRDHLPEQHQKFYGQLPYLVVGSSDQQGQPSASLLTGTPGFISSSNPESIQIQTTPIPGDLLNDNLKTNAAIGLLGIDLSRRRRNRATGRISQISNTGDGFTLAIDQTFGNCPQFITKRDVEQWSQRLTQGPWHDPVTVKQLSVANQKLIEAADTFFIASHYTGDADNPSNGTDVSHRGGEAGFVTVENASTLVIPDYAGNMHFNTLGNLSKNPQAGLLFVDFENGDYLQLSGEIEIIWSGDDVTQFAGAQRLLKFRLQQALSIELV